MLRPGLRDLHFAGADVDGTLITSTGPDANKLHKLAFAHAMKITFDVDTNIGNPFSSFKLEMSCRVRICIDHHSRSSNLLH